MSLRLAVIDSHQLFRELVSRYLSERGARIVCSEATLAQALPSLERTPCEVAIVSPRMDWDIQTMRLRLPTARFLVLLTSPDRTVVGNLLEFGAHGIIAAEAHLEELWQAVEVVHQGGLYLHPAVARLALSEFFGASQPPQLDALEARDKAVLELLAEGRTNAQIAHALGTSSPKVKWLLKSLCRRLGAADRVNLVSRAIQLGHLEPSRPPRS